MAAESVQGAGGGNKALALLEPWQWGTGAAGCTGQKLQRNGEGAEACPEEKKANTCLGPVTAGPSQLWNHCENSGKDGRVGEVCGAPGVGEGGKWPGLGPGLLWGTVAYGWPCWGRAGTIRSHAVSKSVRKEEQQKETMEHTTPASCGANHYCRKRNRLMVNCTKNKWSCVWKWKGEGKVFGLLDLAWESVYY